MDNANQTNIFSPEEIQQLLNEQQDFIDGKTTARNWSDIEVDLNLRFDNSSIS